MAIKLLILALLLSWGWNASAQSSPQGRELPKFMGREVTVTEPEFDHFFPKGPASVCIEGPPQRECYTAPEEFGVVLWVELVQVEKDGPALLFSAASGGTSRFSVHFALLRPGPGKDLQNLFYSDTTVSEESQTAVWNDSTISAAPIFVTANFVRGPEEAYWGGHRFTVSAYVLKRSCFGDDIGYYLEDRFMTARKYDWPADAILASEKFEITVRLQRAAAWQPPCR